MVLGMYILIFYVLQHASEFALLPVSFLSLYIAIVSFRHIILGSNVERMLSVLESLSPMFITHWLFKSFHWN
jgi:hypothetical protein